MIGASWGWWRRSLRSGFLSRKCSRLPTISLVSELSPSHGLACPSASHELLVGTTAWLIFRVSMAGSRKKKDAIWAKEKDLDSVIQTERKSKELTEIINVLARQEEHLLSLYDVKTCWRYIGEKGLRRVKLLVRKYPGIFRYTVDHEKEPWIDLTEEAEQLLEEKESAKEQNKPVVVEKVRKLLMMSVDRRLRVEKLCHLKYMFGFPEEFHHRFLNDYPEYFHVVETSDGPCLELKVWDPLLAVTTREKAINTKRLRSNTVPNDPDSQTVPQMQGDAEMFNYEFEMLHPKGGTPGRREWERIIRFQELPFPSPYQNAANLDPESLEAEKHTVGVIHEFLSLTIDKKSVVSRIGLFKREFNIPHCSESFLERYPGIFYVSHKGEHHVVFLKEGYKGTEVLDKNPLTIVNERFIQLMKKRPSHQLSQGVRQ